MLHSSSPRNDVSDGRWVGDGAEEGGRGGGGLPADKQSQQRELEEGDV